MRARAILKNNGSQIERMIDEKLRLPYTDTHVFPILAKDSLDMTDEDRELLKTFIGAKLVERPSHRRPPRNRHHGPLGRVLPQGPSGPGRSHRVYRGHETAWDWNTVMPFKMWPRPCWRPPFFKGGIYICFHGTVHTVPGVRKNKEKKTFEGFVP